MEKLIMFYVVCCAAAAFGASDYFPAKVGNTWKFDYCSFDGHSRGGTTDSGVVSWAISAIVQQGNTKTITIVQQRTLHRRTYFMSAAPDNYDSIFNPPRVLPPENISFIDDGNALSRSYQRDGTNQLEVLLHDPNSPFPSSICAADTTVKVLNVMRPAKLVITGSCNLASNHNTYDYFLQCEGAGPVAYRYDSHGTSGMVGGHSYEDWVLRSFPTGINHTYAKSGDIRVGNRPHVVPLLGVSVRSALKNNLVYDLRGRIMTNAGCFDKQSKGAGIVVLFSKEMRDNGNDHSN